MDMIIADWKSWAWSLGVAVLAVAGAEILFRLFYKAAARITERRAKGGRGSLLSRSRHPARWIVWIAALLLVIPTLPASATVTSPLYHLLSIALIASITWLSIALLRVVEDFLAVRYRVDIPDNLQARRIGTQVRVLRRTAVGVVIVIGIAVILMTFPVIRNVGAGLFASAGLAGLVVGMAARPSLSNMLAGLQIALTEPIRLDDVVVVEGEWGRVEDIQTTYVVIRIWDERRLILPLSYFIEKPFQNWTRASAELLGTVFWHVDYTVPVDELRGELHRVLESSPLWDKRVWNLQVTDAGEHTVELRALMSCPDSSSAWDLRCLVREHMIKFMQQRYPESLPRARAELRRFGANQHTSAPDLDGAQRQ
jgi:small-conductance mechanosensitive channel